jgi:uncharacterized membrane protein YoaK (UPF0700 family)
MANLPALLPADAVHDQRHIGLWIALTFSAGTVNATALAACQRFVTHVTGTLSRLGADFDQLWLFLEYGAVLVCFVLGAMTSVVLLDGRRLRHREPWPVAPLVLVAAVLGATGALGLSGTFGPFGTTVETAGDFAMLSMLAFAMGLQNAAVATTTGMIVRTTHMTGPVTDFSVALATSLSGGPESITAAARRSVWLRGSKIVAFALGALAATVLARHLGYGAFFVPAAITLLSAARLHVAIAGLRNDGSSVRAST